MTEIFTAKTVDEAKAMAIRKFGKRPNEIRFEVLEEGKKGFLGIGQVDAKVKATYIAPAPKPVAPAPKKEVKKEVSVSTPEHITEVKKETEVAVKEAPKPVVKTESAPVEEKTEKAEVAVKEETEAVAVKEETVKIEVNEEVQEIKEKVEKTVSEPIKKDDMSLALNDFTLIEDESLLHEKVKIARDYIISILNAMQIDAEFTIYQNETGAVINIESNNNGTIIGRRGETLDSIQYLCSIIANKGDKDYFRITIDCLSYRNKRKETLEQLASKVAKSVLRSGRSQQLEPMNPYERRVIHSAISEIEGVSSRSVGEEPYRKIIISSNNPKNNGKRRVSRRDDRKDNRKRNDKSKTPREPMEVKEIDLSTSFEKDYKKPKPEDTMEGGLYGKIEF